MSYEMCVCRLARYFSGILAVLSVGTRHRKPRCARSMGAARGLPAGAKNFPDFCYNFVLTALLAFCVENQLQCDLELKPSLLVIWGVRAHPCSQLGA